MSKRVVHYFVSYAHADDKLPGKLLAELDKQLGACRDYDFKRWRDTDILLGEKWHDQIQDAIRQCDFGLLFISPAFLSSTYIDAHELPSFVIGQKPCLPVALCRIDFKKHDLKGLEDHQLFRYRSDAAKTPRAFADYSAKLQADFALALFQQIAARLDKLFAAESGAASVKTSTEAVQREPMAERVRCPYPGMVPFSSEDARFFYGREGEIGDILQRLRHQRFLLIFGPSGSGKSSLVSAGLLPGLKKSGYFPQGYWAVLQMRPGKHPSQTLGKIINGDAAQPVPALSNLLAHHPPAQRLLLVVDQFEELFAQNDRSEQGRFIASLNTLCAPDKCAVIVLLRADFIGELMNSDLWRASEGARIGIAPLRGDLLRQAIERPATALGVHLEPALLERLLADAANEPGVLPLVQETMVVLWEKMEQRSLTLTAYQQLGRDGRSGFAVAMAIKADATMCALSDTQKLIVRRIFLRLVQFGVGRADTRRQQSVSDLRSADDDPQEFDQASQLLACNRLLTMTGEETASDKRVDIAHEALIDSWPVLHHWLVELRESEKRRRWLEDKAAEWVQLGRGAGGLLDKAQLDNAEAWLGEVRSRSLGISKDFLELLDYSRRHLPQPVRDNFLTQEELDKWRKSAAGMIAVKRRLDITRLISTPNEMAQDWHEAGVELVSDVLLGRFSFVGRIAPKSYYLLEEVWVDEIKKLWAASFRERAGGQNNPERDYFDANHQMRDLLFCRRNAQPGKFRDAKSYLEDRYLAEGSLDEAKATVHSLIRMKAHRIWEKTGDQDQSRVWARAKRYVITFYENIIGAVLDKDLHKTAKILEAFKFSESPNNRLLIINAFEVALVIEFLDKEILDQLRNTVAYDVNMVSVNYWPSHLARRGFTAGEFSYDKESGQIIFEGVMGETEKRWFLGQLEKEGHNKEELKVALEDLYAQSQRRPLEMMIL